MTNNAVAPIEEKPLNQTQLKNLREIVKGDFEDLHTQVITEIDNRASRRIDEIAERYDQADNLEAAQEKLRQAGREAEDKLRVLVSELTSGDIEVQPSSYKNTPIVKVTADVDRLVQRGREVEVGKAREAAARLKRTANQVLTREERQVQRQVLLQGISSHGALELLKDLPVRDDVMTLLVKELETTSGDDLQALMTKEEITAAKKLGSGK